MPSCKRHTRSDVMSPQSQTICLYNDSFLCFFLIASPSSLSALRLQCKWQMPPCKFLHCTKATEFSNVFNVDQWCKSMSYSGNSSKYVTCQVNKSRAIEGVTRCRPASSINFTTRAAKWRKRMLYLAERSSWYISS